MHGHNDFALYEKLKTTVSAGLTESDALQFLAVLSISEYERLIEIFKGQETGFPEPTRKKMVTILERLLLAKRSKPS